MTEIDKIENDKKAMENAQKEALLIFEKKNAFYERSYFVANDKLYSSDKEEASAFDELEYAFIKVKRDLLHYEVAFKPEKLRKDLIHLSNYALMMLIFLDNMPKIKK